MQSHLRVVMAQLNFVVADIAGNTERVIAAAKSARDQYQADLIVFPELTLTGYPPEDLLLRPAMQTRIEQSTRRLLAEVRGITLILGYPQATEDKRYNCASIIQNGSFFSHYYKQHLPNEQVFDEQRYFNAGEQPCTFAVKGIPLSVAICEDLWHNKPMQQARDSGAKLLLTLNASPFHIGKQLEREQLLKQRAQQGDMPIVYCNLVGAQDELVFDGGSCLVDSDGTLCYRAPAFSEGLHVLDFAWNGQTLIPKPAEIAPLPSEEASIYQALVLGLRDYVQKNGFNGVLLGLSGGIDSALVLALAVDALGADQVQAVMMPYHYTSSISLEDAEATARAAGVNYQVIPIAVMVEAFQQGLQPLFEGLAKDTTEENLQARCRGTLLMALSNKSGKLLLTTGNKSEMAVGYATLYGDMAGGFAPIKDVAKTRVFELCRYRNSLSPIIPQRTIDRPPSAELAPGQKDEDSLPPYPILDAILERYIEQDQSAADIVLAGFEAETVRHVLQRVDLSEYKRRQAAIGTRITQRAFGKDRRYPLSCRWQLE